MTDLEGHWLTQPFAERPHCPKCGQPAGDYQHKLTHITYLCGSTSKVDGNSFFESTRCGDLAELAAANARIAELEATLAAVAGLVED